MKLQDISIIRDTSWYEYGTDNKRYFRRRIKFFGITLFKQSKQIKS